MENKRKPIFKILMSIVFAVVILGAYGYVIWKGDFEEPYLSFGAVAGCAVFSLMFVRPPRKKFYLTLALMASVAADYFFVFSGEVTDKNKFIGLCVLCGVQFFYMLYTLSLSKGNGMKVINLGIRAALSLSAYLIPLKVFEISLTNIQLMAAIFALNALVTLLWSILYIKTEWIALFGFLLIVLWSVCIGFTHGGIEALHLSGKFFDFISSHDVEFWLHIPSLFFVALGSVWTKKKQVK